MWGIELVVQGRRPFPKYLGKSSLSNVIILNSSTLWQGCVDSAGEVLLIHVVPPCSLFPGLCITVGICPGSLDVLAET